MSRLNTMYPNDEFLKDISNVIGKVDSKNETQIKKEIEQVGYKEFYRYYKEKDIYIKQLQQENQKLKIQISAREEVANKYKEVIDKAIEYIDKHKENEYRNGRNDEIYLELNEKELKEFLEILKGE